MKTFSERLRHALKTAKMTNRALADKASVHPVSITRWLKGRKVDSETGFRLAAALNVRPDWLLFGAGETTPDPPQVPSDTMTQAPPRLQVAPAEWPSDITDITDAAEQLESLVANIKTTSAIGIPGLVKLGRDLLDRIEELARATILRKQMAFRESLKRPAEPQTPIEP